MKAEKRTDLVMQALGWKGGTVHDLCKEIGCDSTEFLYSDLESINKSFEGGWFAIRTSPNSFKELAKKNAGNLQFFFGVAAGQNLINIDKGA